MNKKTHLFVKSRIYNLMKFGEQTVRITKEARDEMYEYIDDIIKTAVAKIIDILPRKKTGKNKGKLKRITITKEDIKNAKGEGGSHESGQVDQK